MQHKAVCKLLLKVVCGSSFLFTDLFQVSQPVRLTSALVKHYLKEPSIFCTAPDSFVHKKGIRSRHTRSGICDGRAFCVPSAGTNARLKFLLKIRFVVH
jgi:hypothetical protein